MPAIDASGVGRGRGGGTALSWRGRNLSAGEAASALQLLRRDERKCKNKLSTASCDFRRVDGDSRRFYCYGQTTFRCITGSPGIRIGSVVSEFRVRVPCFAFFVAGTCSGFGAEFPSSAPSDAPPRNRPDEVMAICRRALSTAPSKCRCVVFCVSSISCVQAAFDHTEHNPHCPARTRRCR